jgi:hypothetical protein
MPQCTEGSEMSKLQTVEEAVYRVIAGAGAEVEKAAALHDYVRDNIAFGFNKYFDATPPQYTLACGSGHCNHFYGIRFNSMYKLVGESGVASMNAHIERIRCWPHPRTEPGRAV